VLVARYEEPSELAAAIRRACEDPALERALRQHAREAALPFSRAAVDAAEVALYREALEIPTSLRRRTRDRLRYAAWRGRRELRRWRAGFGPGRARELPAEARDLESRG
jgi:hypothetical protein